MRIFSKKEHFLAIKKKGIQVTILARINLLVKLFKNTAEENKQLKESVLAIFREFTNYLNLETGGSLVHIFPSVDFPNIEEISDNIDQVSLFNNYNQNNPSNVLLIGVFKQLLDTKNELALKNSFIQENGYLFINYESKEILTNNENTIPLLILDKFVNYLFYLHDRKLETHSGDCFRNMNQRNFNENIQIISSNLLIQEKIAFCATCSARIVEQMAKLGSGYESNKENQIIQEKQIETVEKQISENVPTNLVQTASKPPPRRIKELQDPNSELSFAQRKQINKFLKDLGILKEPLEDPEYLETRKRFFDGKLSEQVFLQILKRKSK